MSLTLKTPWDAQDSVGRSRLRGMLKTPWDAQDSEGLSILCGTHKTPWDAQDSVGRSRLRGTLKTLWDWKLFETLHNPQNSWHNQFWPNHIFFSMYWSRTLKSFFSQTFFKFFFSWKLQNQQDFKQRCYNRMFILHYKRRMSQKTQLWWNTIQT